MTAALDGEGAAFGILFERHRDRVFRHTLRLVDTIEDAEDLVGIAFAEAWRKRTGIRIVDGSILPWLLITANNLARNLRRARRRYRVLLDGLPRVVPEADPAEAAMERIQAQQDRRLLRAAFNGLSIRDREILTLCVLEDLSTAQAAAAIGIPPGTVKSRLARAKQRLATGLPDSDPQPAPTGAPHD